jgi:hypothetical protein
MAKCVTCTAINARLESLIHPNEYTISTVRALERRDRRTPVRAYNKFCSLHNAKGTATPRIKSDTIERIVSLLRKAAK